MKRQRKKTRSIASYRAASLKGARTKLAMEEARANKIESLTPTEAYHRLREQIFGLRRPTIDLIPKVKWP